MNTKSLLAAISITSLILMSFTFQQEKQQRDGIINRVLRAQSTDSLKYPDKRVKASKPLKMDSIQNVDSQKLVPLPDTITRGMH